MGLLIAGLVAGPTVIAAGAVAMGLAPALRAARTRLRRQPRRRILRRFSVSDRQRHGNGLRLTKRDRPDAPPIISVPQFSASTSLTRLWNGNIKSVVVDGLTIVIPPDMRPSLNRPVAADSGTPASKPPRRLPPLTVDMIQSNHATLVIEPNNPAGVPLVFDIELAKLAEFSTTEPTRFEARLMNPKPRGAIAATGKMGPWKSNEPRKTRVEGDYTLTKADMSVFKGIGGYLDSAGRFNGALDALAVEGTATMSGLFGGDRQTSDASLDVIHRASRRHERQHLSRSRVSQTGKLPDRSGGRNRGKAGKQGQDDPAERQDPVRARSRT